MDIQIEIRQIELDSLHPTERCAVVKMIERLHGSQESDNLITSVTSMFRAYDSVSVTISGKVPLVRIWNLFDRLRPEVYDGPTIVMGVDIS